MRPTKRVSPRAAAAWRRVRVADGPASSNTSTGLGHPLDRDGTDRDDLDEPLGEPERLAGQPRRARRRELLHARGEVGGLAHRRVVHAEIAPDRPHDHLAGVEADANLDLDAVIPPDLGRVAADGLLHREGGVAGAHGVVLVGQGGAEERHDAIPHDLVDGALVAVHRLHHALENGVQELARLLRVAVGEQLERAFHVGEQHGHLLALPFESVSGR